MTISIGRVLTAAALVLLATSAQAADKIRLANLKFAHYGAISYMKELAPKYDLEIEERFFAKGIDILPAIVAGEVDVRFESFGPSAELFGHVRRVQGEKLVVRTSS